MKIANFDLCKKVLIIAEIGNNHEGDYALAEELIAKAAEAGADAVKFQTIVPDKLVSVKDSARIKQLSKFQLSPEQFASLSDKAKQLGVMFLSTPFCRSSVDFLNELVPAFKIASGDNDFYPLIEKICQTGKPIIISTGLSDINEIKVTKNFILSKWQQCGTANPGLAILHCVCSYPTPAEQVNLLAIPKLLEIHDVVGYSDHSLGNRAAISAVALGARVIEKHFTIDKNYSSFRDHQLSADPKDLQALVEEVRNVEIMLGHLGKVLQECELENKNKVRRSIVAARDLAKDDIIAETDLSWVRPRDGLSPGQEHLLIGKRLNRDIGKGTRIILEDIA